MRSLRRLLIAFALVSPLALAGCKQGVGDRCQVQTDCDDGLLCILAAGGTPQTGGTCQPPGGLDGAVTVDMASTDSATTADLLTPPADGSSTADLAPAADLAQTD